MTEKVKDKAEAYRPPTLAETRREMRTEFETASLALMRAFEAHQRYTAGIDDTGAEQLPPQAQFLEPVYDVAVSLHYVLRCIAVSPTGLKAAAAIAATLDRAEIERVASDRVEHPPTRKVTIAGLTGLIEERQDQLVRFVEQVEQGDATIASTMDGRAVAYRQIVRERDVLIHARDVV